MQFALVAVVNQPASFVPRTGVDQQSLVDVDAKLWWQFQEARELSGLFHVAEVSNQDLSLGHCGTSVVFDGGVESS